MAITPVHHLMDVTLFDKIVVCETTASRTRHCPMMTYYNGKR
jgi:hypothetical protein